jgi:hypothetical protein
MADFDGFIILRVGPIDENFKISILDRMENKKIKKVPVWAYNKKKAGKGDAFFREKTKTDNAYVFFLPNNKNGICGLAKVSRVIDRQVGPLITLDETDEDIGWESFDNWDCAITIEKYWDFSIFRNTTFSHDTIQNIHKLPQHAIHKFPTASNKATAAALYDYLKKHAEYIIENISPTFCV